MKTLIAGSRSFQWKPDPNANRETNQVTKGLWYDWFDGLLDSAWSALDPYLEWAGRKHELITGYASGVDQESAGWFDDRFVGTIRHFPADWDTHGKGAGYKRNVTMVNECDRAIIIWDGESKGTKHTIDLLRKSGKPFVLVEVNNGQCDSQ